MLMVIFGAGASYDSGPDFPNARQEYSSERLPLANQLFERRDYFADALELYKECYGIIPLLRDKRSESVEQVLEKFRNEIEEDSRRITQLIALQFYLRDIIRHSQGRWQQRTQGITNYTALLEQHYCPVKSRIESVGWGHRVSFRGSRTAARPVKWAFSRKG